MIITSGDLSLISLINPDIMSNILGVPSVISNINLIHSKSLAIKMNLIYQIHQLL